MKLYVNQPVWIDISLDGVYVRRGTDGLFLNVPPGKDVVWLNDTDLTWITERVSLADPGLGMDTLMSDFSCLQIPNMDLPMNTTAFTVLPLPTEQQPQPIGVSTLPLQISSRTDRKPIIPRKYSPIVNSRERHAFMLYCKENEESVKKEIGTQGIPGSVMGELDRRWKLLTEEEKKQWKNT